MRDDAEQVTRWPQAQLGDLLTRIEAGQNFKCDAKPPADNEIGIVKVSAVTWGEYDEAETKTVTDPERVDPKLFVQRGDFLFSRANTIELVGACVIAHRVTKRIMLSDKILRFHFRGVEPAWVLYFLRSLRGRRQIEALATGNQESMRNIGQERIRSISLPLPPKHEQRVVLDEVEKQLTRIQTGVAALVRVQANLKRYRASVLKAACEGHLVPTEAELARRESRDYEPAAVLLQRILKERRHHWEVSELAKLEAKGKRPTDDRWKARYEEPTEPDRTGLWELPEGWCWATADALCDGVDSGNTPTAEYFASTGEGIPFLKVYNLTFNGSLDFTKNPTWINEQHHREKMTRSRVVPGDVLINIVGPPLGKVSIVPATHAEWNMNQAIVRFRALPGLGVGFLAIWLQGPESQRWLNSTAKTTTSQVNLAVTTCRRLPIPLPPFAEQARIFQEVQRRLSLMEACFSTTEQRLVAAEHLRQSILASAFEGKLTFPPAPARQNEVLKPAQTLAPRSTPSMPAGFTDA